LLNITMTDFKGSQGKLSTSFESKLELIFQIINRWFRGCEQNSGSQHSAGEGIARAQENETTNQEGDEGICSSD